MMKKTVATFAALAMVLVACGGSAGDETINLIVNPWTASRLNAEVAKVIIEQELGNTVEIVDVNENDAMFTGMADGTLDAVLEIWPSGITDAEQAYFDAGTVNNIGQLGTVGKIGWFVPDYVIADHPELATWEGFADPENAKLFATAETGDLGRFLGTDPSYSQYDEQIITNLGLPFQVIFSGSEPATVAEVDSRVAAGEPIVLYWWTPTAAVAKYNLVNVALPAWNSDCGASAAAGDGGVDCDYPEDVLFKAASAELKDKAPDVYTFLQNFTITTEDQLSMLPPVEIDGDEPADVAARWVADNESVWRAWLP
ncbi:MAG: hypothetical protein OEO77_02505 [Acidimicrobiia bacterium]|nr:hypothetical protein [Acidimicrobiia bacterium]